MQHITNAWRNLPTTIVSSSRNILCTIKAVVVQSRSDREFALQQVRRCTKIFFALALTSLGATEGAAKDYSFSWQQNPEPGTGYKLYYKKGGNGIAPSAPFNGTDAVEGPSPIDVGKTTSYKVTGLDDNAIYYFTLTAYNENGESEFTKVLTLPEDVIYTPPKPTIKAIQIN